MSSVGANVVPIFQQQNEVFRPMVAKQRNINMLQSPYDVCYYAPMVNFSPFQVNMNDFGYDNHKGILHQVPTMEPVRNQSQATTTQTYNALNLNPRTLMHHAQAPYGNARGQLSMITDLELNSLGKPLPVNNSDVFRDVAFDKKIQKVRPSKV
jgi:hypothetical protein